MPEPTTSTGVGLTAGLIALLGPLAGEYATILFASLAGAMWAMARRPASTRLDAALFLVRVVGAAFVFASLLAWGATALFGVPATHALATAAFFVGAVGDRWQSVIGDLLDRVRTVVRGHRSEK